VKTKNNKERTMDGISLIAEPKKEEEDEDIRVSFYIY